MILESICQWIENNSSLIIGNTLIYGHRMEKTADRCILASEVSPGASDFYLPDRADKIVTFVSRSESYQEANRDLQDLFDLIHGSSGWNLPAIESGILYHACVMQSVGLPTYLGQDERNLHEFSCAFEFKIQKI